jgi:hypothetical protein
VYTPKVTCLRFQVENETSKDFREYVIWFARHEGVLKTAKPKTPDTADNSAAHNNRSGISNVERDNDSLHGGFEPRYLVFQVRELEDERIDK